MEAQFKFQGPLGEPFPYKLPPFANFWHYAESRRDYKNVKRAGVQSVYWDVCKLLWMEGRPKFPPRP